MSQQRPISSFFLQTPARGGGDAAGKLSAKKRLSADDGDSEHAPRKKQATSTWQQGPAGAKTPQAPLPPRPAVESSARKPDAVDARRRRMMRLLGDGAETKDAAKAREISENFSWLTPNKARDASGRRPSDPEHDARTVQVPKQVFDKLSASQQSYWKIKQSFRDTILFFKIGKFYELYEDDAQVGADLFGWKMINSGVGHCRQVGCPESGVEEAVSRLTAAGFKVGRIEQMETAAEAKKKRGPKATIIRELTKIHSPATMTGSAINADAVHLLALCEEVQAGAGLNDHVTFGFAFLDAAAGHFYLGSLSDGAGRANLTTLLTQVAPKEVLHARNGLTGATARILAYPPLPAVVSSISPGTEFPSGERAMDILGKLDDFGGPDGLPESVLRLGDGPLSALAALVLHLQRLHCVDELASHAALVSPYELYSAALRLDGPTLANLELLENSTGGTAGSLLTRLDTCASAGGKRLLRRWLCRPLTDVQAISRRTEAVDNLQSRPELVQEVRRAMRAMPDLERALGAARNAAKPLPLALPPQLLKSAQKKRLLALGTAARAVRAAMTALSEFAAECGDESCDLLLSYAAAARTCSGGGAAEALDLIEAGLVWPDTQAKGKGKKGGGGAPSLAPALLADVPAPESPADEEDAALQAEMALTTELLVQLNSHARRWEELQEGLASLDVLASFAVFASAAEGPTCRATFVQHSAQGAVLDVKQLWHPCVGAGNGHGAGGRSVVPNDLALGSAASPARALLLTGPNMGGKSTLLRATCTAVIMAQMGCPVAAAQCQLSPADCIFTRLGASDRIMAGESTFLVECQETSNILKHATPKSLVVLDELGRGTSTFDGCAIAAAVLQHLSEKVDARFLCSTHFHSLCADFAGCARIAQAHMAALVGSRSITPGSDGTTTSSSGGGDASDGITFLFRLQPGPCPRSYGLQVARLAGIPRRITEVAHQAGQQLEERLRGAFGGADACAGHLTPAEKELLSGLSAGCCGGGRLQDGRGDAHNSPGVAAELRELWEEARSVSIPQAAAPPMVH